MMMLFHYAMSSSSSSRILALPILHDIRLRAQQLDIALDLQHTLLDDLINPTINYHYAHTIQALETLILDKHNNINTNKQRKQTLLHTLEHTTLHTQTTLHDITQQTLNTKQLIEHTQTQILDIQTHNQEIRQRKLFYQSFKDVSKVPFEAKILVFQFLGPADLARCLQVCKLWKHELDFDAIWKIFLIQKAQKKKKVDEKIKQRMDPSLNKLAIHVSLDSSSGLNKETVFNQCMSHVKKSLESISTRYEELHSKLQQEEKNRKVLLARLRKHRAELSETLSRRSLVDQTLESNRKEMQLLASQVSELEKQSKSAGEAYSLLKKATDDAMHSYERRILDLEGEISKLENDEEYMNLRRNRKVLANEVKWLRESIDRKVLDRDRVRMNLDRVRGVLFDSSSK